MRVEERERLQQICGRSFCMERPLRPCNLGLPEALRALTAPAGKCNICPKCKHFVLHIALSCGVLNRYNSLFMI